MVEQQTSSNETTHPEHRITSSKTDVLGIISIVIAFTGFPLIGFIVGLIGASKAKKENYSITLSRLGWILNLVVMIFALLVLIIVLVAIPALQRNQRDVATRNDLVQIDSEIQNYRSNNFGKLPNSLADLQLERLVISGNITEGDIQYILLPAGCSNSCTDYSLSVELENGETYKLSSN